MAGGYAAGSDIRIGLDLIASATGASAINEIGNALSSLAYINAALPSDAPTWFAGVGAAAAAAALDALAFDSALSLILTDATNLQYSSAQMDLSLHGTSAQIAELNPKIIEWADASLYTTQQVHQLVQALSEHGLDVSQILDGDGQAAIQLGEAIGADPVDAANLLASTLQMFSAQGLSAAQAANILTGAFYNGLPSVSDLETAFGQAGGRAAVMGISLQDLATTLDIMKQAGLQATSAGAGLNYFLQTLADPTNKAATAFNFVGLTIVNTTSPAFEKLKRDLDAAGGAAAASVKNFDGTSVGLNAMFKQAQALKLIPLNETFNEWAVSSGAMSSKLFDSKGNIKSLGDTVTQVIQAIQDKAGGNKEMMDTLLSELFNVRSGRAIGVLAGLTNFKDHYNRILSQIGQTDAQKDANQLLGTQEGSAKELGTTATSFGAALGDPLLKNLTHLTQSLNTFLGGIMKLHPQLVLFLGIFIAVGAVIATVTAVVLGIVVVVALMAAVVGGPAVAAFGIVLAVIPLVAAIIAFLVVHWNDLTRAVGPWVGAIGKTLGQTFRDFLSAVHPLVQRFAGLGQAFSRLGTALHPLLPILQITLIGLAGIGALIMGVLIGAFMALVQGVVTAAGGILLFVTGFIQLFTGLFAFFTDLAHLFVAAFEWVFGGETQQASDKMTRIMGQLGNDLHTIWDGIVNMILGIVTTFVGTIVAMIAGFVDGIIRWFQNLYDTLVGHSIVPDMINGIVSWFEQLPGRAVAAVTSLASQVKGLFSSLAQDAASWGSNLVKMLASGILSAASWVTNAASNIASSIRNILGHHSPPAEGPLADDDQYMPNMMRMFATGIQQHTPLLANAATNAANTTRFALTQGMTPAGLALGGVGSVPGNQTVIVQVGNQQLFQLMMNQLTGQMQLNGLGRAFK